MPFGTTAMRARGTPAAVTWPASTSVTGSTRSAQRQTKRSAARARRCRRSPPKRVRSSASGAFTSSSSGTPRRQPSSCPRDGRGWRAHRRCPGGRPAPRAPAARWSQPIGHLRQLAQRPGQQAADARDRRALAAQRHGVVGRRADDADLVPGSAQRGDHRLDMHALPVMGLDAMAVEDAHARAPFAVPAAPPIRARRSS